MKISFIGSAVMAFEEVCPERIELVHKQFRKLCNLLADIDEWGQVVIVNMLLRYARYGLNIILLTKFLNRISISTTSFILIHIWIEMKLKF